MIARTNEILDAMARMLALPSEKVHQAFIDARFAVTNGARVVVNGEERLILMTSEGLDNCARRFGEPEASCQACGGKCPEAKR